MARYMIIVKSSYEEEINPPTTDFDQMPGHTPERPDPIRGPGDAGFGPVSVDRGPVRGLG